MTEEEAKTKWCPFVRAANKNNEADVSIGGMNRWRGDELLPKGTRCIGSACMAWRWDRGPEHNPPETEQWSVSSGHCGLAGRP